MDQMHQPGDLHDRKTGALLLRDGALVRPVHIVASPFKTGTSSLGEALIVLGVGTRDMDYDGTLLPTHEKAIRALNQLAHRSDGFADFATRHGAEVRETLAGLTSALAPYDVFHDAPFGHTHIHPFVRKVLAPKARFIWVNRDPESWIASVRNWEVSHPEIYRKHAAWEKNPEFQARIRLRLWRRQYRDFCRMRRGAPADCLELAWGDLADFTALAAFYGVAAPDRPFPQRNMASDEGSWLRRAPVRKLRRLLKRRKS